MDQFPWPFFKKITFKKLKYNLRNSQNIPKKSCISFLLHQVVNIIMAFFIVLYHPLITSSYISIGVKWQTTKFQVVLMWFFAQLTSPNTFYHLYTKNIDVEEQNGIFESHKLQYLPLIFHKLRIPFFLAWIASTKNEKKSRRE